MAQFRSNSHDSSEVARRMRHAIVQIVRCKGREFQEVCSRILTCARDSVENSAPAAALFDFRMPRSTYPAKLLLHRTTSLSSWKLPVKQKATLAKDWILQAPDKDCFDALSWESLRAHNARFQYFRLLIAPRTTFDMCLVRSCWCLVSPRQDSAAVARMLACGLPCPCFLRLIGGWGQLCFLHVSYNYKNLPTAFACRRVL